MAGGLLAAIALVVLAASSSDLTGATVREIGARADPWALALAVALMTTGLVFLALRWRAMMVDRARVEVWPLTGIFVIGNLLNYALPGPVGEFAGAALAGRRFGISAEMALAAGIHARFLGLGLAGGVAGVVFLTTEMAVPPDIHLAVGLATAAIAAGAVGLGALSARPNLLRAVAAQTLGRVGFLRGLHASVDRLATSLHAVGRLGLRRYAWGALWALCGHATVIAGIAVAAKGVGAEPQFAGLVFTYAMATAGAIVLFAFPGSQVGWDAMFTLLLVSTAGLSTPDALAVTLLVRVQQLFTVVLGGVALLRLSAQPGFDGPNPPAPPGSTDDGDDSGAVIG